MTRTATILTRAFRAGNPASARRTMAASRPTQRTVYRAAKAAGLNPLEVLPFGDWWDRE